MVTLKRNRKGITLVELMIVIAVIGILLSVATPAWMRHRDNADLKTAARGIAGDIFNMKQRAASESSPYLITFDLAQNRYQMIDATTGIPEQTRNVSEFGPGVILTGTTFGGDSINFFARGTTSWGTVNLRNNRNSTAQVRVNAAGRTHVTFNMQ